MKTLAVRQPWATLLAEGVKTLEIRSWRTAYRGPLLIAASGRPCRLENDAGVVETLPTQCLVCVVDLVDCRPATEADEKAACCGILDGEFAWEVANPRMVRPVPHKGRLMLYETPDVLIDPLPPDRHYLDVA